MNVCLLAAMLAVAQAPPAVPPGGTYAAGHDTATVPPSPAVPTLDGQWTLIYAERDGRIQEVSHERAVTIRGDALTLTRDGRPQ
ncbi:MAG: hypothetical protein JO112_03895, partial [Planctomycetes bacterium]|nr:hypothetical protein [Planctomycetota bacterium]